MITLSNGHAFEYMAASGALAYDGRGWPWEWPLRWMGLLDPKCFTIVTKTLTAKPRLGNLRWTHPWTCVRAIRHGTVNAIGLTNPGLDWWLESVAPRISQLDLVCSITDDNPDVLAGMAERLNDIPIRAIELNASCPNTSSDLLKNAFLVETMVREVHKVSRHPLILKLSIVHDYVRIANVCEGMVEAIAINSVPWSVAYPKRPSPLANLGGGGVSGKAAQKWTWKMVLDLSTASHIPVIGPSVWNYGDIAQLRTLGAKAISFGALFLRAPWRPTAFIRRDQKQIS